MMSCVPMVSSFNSSSFDFLAAYKFAKTAVYHMMSSNGRLSDYNAAEEILSDTIDKVLDSSHLFNPEKGKLFTWVYTIAMHCRNDYFEHQNRLHSKEVYMDDISYSEQSQVGSIYADESYFEICEYVNSAIDHLSPRDREIIRYHMKGYKNEEIAEKLSISNNLVRSRVCRIRARLHDMLNVAA